MASADRSWFFYCSPANFLHCCYIGCSLPLSESIFIARLRRLSGRQKDNVLLGIGDDCAVLQVPTGHETLITTDFSLEGTHFRRDWHPPRSVGHRCLARGLSDISAMGGAPIAAFLSLALPGDVSQDWVDDFLRGFMDLAIRSDTVLAGGDTAESKHGVLADIIVLGSAPQGTAVRRSGARPGDQIYVSGALGGAAAAIEQLTKSPGSNVDPHDFPRHFFPEPRLELGRLLRERYMASAMIDLSDGLSTDLGHICQESNVGAEINATAIPLATAGSQRSKVDTRLALHGGEDYELLFTAKREIKMPNNIDGIPVTCIGQVVEGSEVILCYGDGRREPLQARGWEHFRS